MGEMRSGGPIRWVHTMSGIVNKWCSGNCAGVPPKWEPCPKLTPDFECEYDVLMREEAEAAARAAWDALSWRERNFLRVMDRFSLSIIPDGLWDYLRTAGFFDAPASIHHHGAYPGALYDHSFTVMQALVSLTRRLDLQWQHPRSPYIVGMFHDLCKVDNYRHKDGSGEAWEYNNAALLPGHGEKSVILLSQFMTLTEEEMLCIRWHMGAFDDKEHWNHYGRACEKYPNVLYTHTADMIAARVLGV